MNNPIRRRQDVTNISRANNPSFKGTQSLQRCLRDMVALSVLPSLWSGLGLTEIAESLADVLTSIFRADLVYVRLQLSDAGDAYEAVRASGRPPAAYRVSAIGAALAPWLSPQPSPAPITISNPIGAGRLRLFIVPIARGSAYEVACVCSQQAEFPTETDHLLGRVACNQAAAALCRYAVFPAGADNLSRSELRYTLEYIKDNLGSELSLREMAGVAGVSINHFASLFKQATGLSPHQYVIRRRVEKANILLRRSDLSIGEIALQVGFYDSSHLNRHFKHLTRLTPRAMRKKS